MISEFQQRLGYHFTKPELLEQSLTHKSFRHERSNQTANDNERLEFLGDAVLDLALSDILMREFPQDSEGPLSKKRASLVNEDRLAEVARELGLEQVMKLGKGEKQTGGMQKPRILASTLEAILGAVFLDSGYEQAYQVISRLLTPCIVEIAGQPDYISDFKTRLQEKMQELHRIPPSYILENETGPDHDKTFEVSVRIQERVLATGMGRSKKAAEQEAAKKALEQLS
jgi:ribonuclease-3